MPLKATYPGQNQERQVSGFKIITCLDPATGFGSNFYVYLHEELMNDEDDFSPITFPAIEPKLRGTVTLTNKTFISYKFDEIDLVGVETFVTYGIKHRILIFNYNRNLLNTKPVSDLINAESGLQSSQLREPKKPYRYALAEEMQEPLLYFNSLLNPSAALQAIQISSFRTATNSFLTHALQLQSDIINDKKYNLSFKLNGVTVDASAANLEFLFIDESWGSFLVLALPSLDKITSVGGRLDTLVRVKFEMFKPVDFYAHYTARPSSYSEPSKVFGKIGDDKSIETGIIVLRNGEGKQLSPLIV